MGFEVPLEELFSFIYKAPFDNGLTEHELDHVMLGYYDGIPEINKEEVASWKWMDLDQVAKEIKASPEHYTAWFKIIFDRFYKHIKA
jgi:isopentenyl-diphosphate delta-isomerase